MYPPLEVKKSSYNFTLKEVLIGQAVGKNFFTDTQIYVYRSMYLANILLIYLSIY